MNLKFARPVHPGEYLREEYMIPLGLSAGMLARKLNLPRTRIERIMREEIGMSADTALRLARYFGTTPQFWMNFQQAYELAAHEEKLRSELESIEPMNAAA